MPAGLGMKELVKSYFIFYFLRIQDELVSASSVAFSLDGSKIYCGFNKAIRIFDSSRPGRDSYFRDITGMNFIYTIVLLISSFPNSGAA